MYCGRSERFSGRGAGKASVYGNILLSVLVYDGEKAVPGTGKMYIHGADTDGSDSTTDQAERTELQDRFRRSMCSEKTGGKPEEHPQLCGFCTDI